MKIEKFQLCFIICFDANHSHILLIQLETTMQFEQKGTL